MNDRAQDAPYIRRLNMEVIVMRELNKMELDFVSGGTGVCSANEFGGIKNTSTLTDDLISIYESLIAATSYMIERVAKAL